MVAPNADAGEVGSSHLHAGVAAEAHERDRLVRWCRYLARRLVAGRHAG
jgi:hypothetical protein